MVEEVAYMAKYNISGLRTQSMNRTSKLYEDYMVEQEGGRLKNFFMSIFHREIIV